jgi:GNAT superfamily N-acetyltransferase
MTAEPPLTVRTAGSGDLDLVAGLHGLGAPGPAHRRAWARMAASPEVTVYLAERSGRPVGTATLTLLPNITYGGAPSALIEAVTVIPEARRRGVATALLRRALADAGAAGCHKVQLLSHKRHATDGAHALYAGLGFVPEAEGFRLYLGPDPV